MTRLVNNFLFLDIELCTRSLRRVLAFFSSKGCDFFPGDKKYMFGDCVSELDCTMFGLLVQMKVHMPGRHHHKLLTGGFIISSPLTHARETPSQTTDRWVHHLHIVSETHQAHARNCPSQTPNEQAGVGGGAHHLLSRMPRATSQTQTTDRLVRHLHCVSETRDGISVYHTQKKLKKNVYFDLKCKK